MEVAGSLQITDPSDACWPDSINEICMEFLVIVTLSATDLTFKAPRKKMPLKMSSAANNCLTLLTN